MTWDLRGDSFATPVLVVPAGTEVVIKNSANAPRSLAAVEAPKLLPGGPLNPSGTRSFRVPEGAQRYTIRDADAPHVRGTLVVIAAGWAVAPDATGRFEFPDVPDGTYKLRVWYREGWIDRTDDPVVVGGKAKVELKPRIPAGYPLVKAAAPAAGGPT